MPRAKPKDAPPYFQVHPFRLSVELREELIDLLGVDAEFSDEQTKINKAITTAEHYVGRYMGIAAVERELPGHASLIAELNAFIKRGQFKEVALSELYPCLQYKFQ